MTFRSGKSGNWWARVALQVNPYAYVQAHRPSIVAAGHQWMTSESAYNAATVGDAVDHGVSVVGLTDHFVATSSDSLRTAFEAAGVVVLPGFEAKSLEGVHLLCLFSPAASSVELEHHITELVGSGTSDRRNASSKFGVEGLCAVVHDRGGICIAAHALTGGGLLRVLHGDARVNAWKALHLAGVCVDDATPDRGVADILENKDANYKRRPKLAVLRSSDVVGPAFGEEATWTWMKLCSQITDAASRTDPLQTLLQALREPASRVSFAERLPPTLMVSAVEWVGSPLFGDARVDFTPGTNVLIGGRGTGKSSVLASIAWALDLRSGLNPTNESNVAPLSLLVGEGEIRVELSVEGETVLISRRQGRPPDALPPGISLDSYGQGELDRSSANPTLRLRLIERFCVGLEGTRRELTEVRARLQELSAGIADLESKLAPLESARTELDQLQHTLSAARAAGLSEVTSASAAARAVQSATTLFSERLAEFAADGLDRTTSSFSEWLDPLRHAVDGIEPGTVARANLGEVESGLRRVLDESMRSVREEVADALAVAADCVLAANESFESAEAERLAILSTLGAQEAEVPRLEEHRVRLEAEVRRGQELQAVLAELRQDWMASIDVLTDLLAQEIECLRAGSAAAAKAVGGRVKLALLPAADPTDLVELLRSHNVSEQAAAVVVDLLRRPDGPSDTRELARWIRGGRSLDVQDGRTLRSFNSAVSEYGDRLLRSIESVDLRPSLEIQLRVVTDSSRTLYRRVEDLSVGQRATALLLLVLCEGQAPVLFDQPEDDLDNKFIAADLVPILGRTQHSRQSVIASHNANIAVLSGTDKVIEMIGNSDRAAIGRQGSIDNAAVATAVQETLEGGRAAFELRQRRYGWL